ncbi:Hsp20/alpha crystallin family protein [Thalassobacillus pellis]|uniref:Hsp20/alpha crystallin family protein n=1 Tax=Thalassobacillus pellis TaxID=748008 RepID=UPI0019617A2A|nr:Hsp20/alpha crystallin family protein [Thalassobacillus pellis]MBM7553396.1 HSP20 family protein [Thalassobacillus pellis]
MNQFDDWKKNLDRFFGNDFWGDFEGLVKPPLPQMNLYQYDNELLCMFSIPGLNDMNKVDVFVDHAVLEIKGIVEVNQKGGQQVKGEIMQGAFERKIDLPYPVRSDKIQASYKHGLLIIQLHRLISDTSNKNRIRITNLEDD